MALFIRFLVMAIAFFVFVQLALALAIWILGGAFGLFGVPVDVFGSVPIAVLLIFMVVVMAVNAVRRTTSPVAELMEAAERVADGNYAARVRPRGPRAVRRLVDAFNAMAERLESSGSQRRQLLADVTHELRTPLSVIQGKLEGALDGVYPRDDEHLRAVLEETRHMSRLVEDLRILSLAEGGGLRLDRQATPLDEIVDEAVESYRAQALNAGVTLDAALPADLPAVDVDAVRVREVLDNLLSNALRYTPGGGTISVSAAREGTHTVSVRVRDSGRGLREDERELIFERFQREPASPGSGLGLAIARSLVRAHGGDIAAESDGPGRGTTIRFTLPVVDA